MRFAVTVTRDWLCDFAVGQLPVTVRKKDASSRFNCEHKEDKIICSNSRYIYFLN